MNTPIRAALAAVLIAFVGACGSGDDGARDRADHPAGDTPGEDTSTTTSTEAPTTTAQTEPLNVLVTGDSMASELALGVEAALEPDVAAVDWLLTPTLGTEPNQSSLVARIGEDDVDVAIVMVGIWERRHQTASGFEIDDDGFAEEYVQESLAPIRDAVEATGGLLLLVGPPPLRVTADQAEIVELERIWEDFARSHDAVDFVDSDDWIGGGGVYVDVDTEGGDATRLRSTDGIHLCKEGALRITSGILDQLAPELDGRPDVDPAWQDGSWLDHFTDETCPGSA